MPDYIVDGHHVSAANEDEARAEVRRLYFGHEAESVRLAPTYGFRIRVEFDVEVEESSHVAAAFAAAEWLQETYRANRISYLQYEVKSDRDLRDGNGTQYVSVDLQELTPEDDDSILPYPFDERACVRAGEHRKGQLHRWQECPIYREGA